MIRSILSPPETNDRPEVATPDLPEQPESPCRPPAVFILAEGGDIVNRAEKLAAVYRLILAMAGPINGSAQND